MTTSAFVLVWINWRTIWWDKVWWLPWWLSSKKCTCQRGRHRFYPWVRKIPWRMKWQPILLFLPGKSHGERSLVDYGPRGLKELDMTGRLNNKQHLPKGILAPILASDLNSAFPSASRPLILLPILSHTSSYTCLYKTREGICTSDRQGDNRHT